MFFKWYGFRSIDNPEIASGIHLVSHLFLDLTDPPDTNNRTDLPAPFSSISRFSRLIVYSIQLQDFADEVGVGKFGLGFPGDVEVAGDADFVTFGFEEFAETGVVDAVTFDDRDRCGFAVA